MQRRQQQQGPQVQKQIVNLEMPQQIRKHHNKMTEFLEMQQIPKTTWQKI